MGRVGFLGRIMVILMAALLAVIATTAGIDYLAHRSLRPSAGIAYPRIVHAAGIIVLIKDADVERRREIVQAANNELVRVRVADAAPKAAPTDIPAPLLAARLAAMIGAPVAGLAAYTTTNMSHPPDRSGVEGRLTRAELPLADGRVLLIEWLDPPKIVFIKLFGFPPSAWAGILGFGVAALALFTASREVRPLRRLTASVSAFDGNPPPGPSETEGAPDIRRLVRAVHGMQERVAALLAERSFLVGAISHDLRIYLTRLRLRTEAVADEDLRERMIGDLDQMTRMIDTSLAFARATTSVDNHSRIDLGDLVAVEVEEHAALGPMPKLDGIYADNSIVWGDQVALRRVVCNVLDNALRFARNAVLVRVERAAAHERILIEDDGPGIAEDQRAAVFDPFYHTGPSRDRGGGGTGLGLAIARQIVEAHGGKIEIATATLRGAAFVITLPACRG